VTGGTVTVQVYVDGRPLYDDTQRPVSDSGWKEATDLYIVPAGSVVTTTIEATSGTPAGTANVSIDTEPYTLVPRSATVELHGRDRLRVSNRRAAAAVNAGMAPSVEARGIAARRMSAIERSQVAAAATTGQPVIDSENPMFGDRGEGGGGGSGGPGVGGGRPIGERRRG
jgi:hypothetical protein